MYISIERMSPKVKLMRQVIFMMLFRLAPSDKYFSNFVFSIFFLHEIQIDFFLHMRLIENIFMQNSFVHQGLKKYFELAGY